MTAGYASYLLHLIILHRTPHFPHFFARHFLEKSWFLDGFTPSFL